jgi:NDP-sugar pyrophosphorylase family protein
VADCVLGSGTKIGNNCDIRMSVVGKNCIVGDNVKLSNTIIWDNSSIEVWIVAVVFLAVF